MLPPPTPLSRKAQQQPAITPIVNKQKPVQLVEKEQPKVVVEEEKIVEKEEKIVEKEEEIIEEEEIDEDYSPDLIQSIGKFFKQ